MNSKPGTVGMRKGNKESKATGVGLCPATY